MNLPAQRLDAVDTLVAEARRVVAEAGVNRSGLARIGAALESLAAREDLFPQRDFPPGQDGGSALYRLAEDTDGQFALYAVTVAPGQSPPPHDHGTWAVIASVRGREHNTLFVNGGNDADGSPLLATSGEFLVAPGTHIVLLPHEIHTIRELDDRPGLHLHFYGLALDRQTRRVRGAPAADAPGGGSPVLLRAPLVTAAALKDLIRGEAELAILDVREEGAFATGHLLFAASAPLSRLELLIERLVPRRGVRIVLTDADEALAHRAAGRLTRFGYRDVSVLRGGVAAWAAAGYELFSGVHVPSKAFGEIVEQETGTPHVSAADVARLCDRGEDLVILDSRPFDEFRRMSIPNGIDVPGAELVLRARAVAPRPETLVVVNCAGRTRSIIGAQSLIDAGLPNRVVALENGTMGWEFAGLALEHGATRSAPPPDPESLAWAREAAARAARCAGVRRLSWAEFDAFRAEPDRSLYVFDVRSPEEYLAGHLPGARHAAGGQLVQETDRYVGTLRSRIVLVDAEDVRAPMTAAWLVQLGWREVYLLETQREGPLETGPEPRLVPGLIEAQTPWIDAAGLAQRISAQAVAVFDIGGSPAFRQGHLPGAWSTVRARLAEAAARSDAPLLVVVAGDDALARLGAAELARATGRDVRWLLGGTAAWRDAGLPLETGAAERILAPDDVYAGPYAPDVPDPAAAKRAYLEWETGLVARVARDGDARFRPLGPGRQS